MKIEAPLFNHLEEEYPHVVREFRTWLRAELRKHHADINRCEGVTLEDSALTANMFSLIDNDDGEGLHKVGYTVKVPLPDPQLWAELVAAYNKHNRG